MAPSLRTVISPGRYVQGKGSIHHLGEYLKPIGSTPLLVADDLVWGLVGHDVEASLTAAGLPARRETFHGIPSAKEVDRLVEVIKQAGADVVVAVGGGSTIDAVKAAGFLAGIRWANCPTVASTDAPCSALSVIYTEDGEFEEYRFFPRNPDLVLVDSQVVANAPVRAAGGRCRGRTGHLARGPGDRAVQLRHDGRRSPDADRHRPGPAQLGRAVGQRAPSGRRGAGPRGDPGGRESHRGEHAAVRTRVRVGWAGRGARGPQRAHRGRRHARPRARTEGEYRLGHPAGARRCALGRGARLRRVHHAGRPADDADRGRAARGRYRRPHDRGRRRDRARRDDPRDAVRGPQRRTW